MRTRSNKARGSKSSYRIASVLGCLLLGASTCLAQDMPRLAQDAGRASLIVDGKPYLILGAQVDNSSGWPERLQQLWPAAEKMRLNTLEVPVYWEQMEPRKGTFDFSVVDAILKQAREHKVRLVLLWFGTWKNGRMHYVPDWVKSDTVAYPRMRTPDGGAIDVLSANAPANLAADRAAYVALMEHLRLSDPAHTVIMMQVENESGALGAVRDFSSQAQKQFAGPVPGSLVAALHKGKGGSWKEVFGDRADETFQAWSVAQYIGEIAAAGKKVLPLPMYANNWLQSPRGYPVTTAPGVDYPSGGPTVDMLPVWKAGAPALDFIAPDIYVPNSERYRDVMHSFHTPDNSLMIPESLGFEPFPGASGYARYLFYALGDGAVGFANFGLDRVHLEAVDPEVTAQIEGFRLLGSFDRELAQLAFAGKVQTAVEENGIAQRELKFGDVRVVVSYPPAYDPPASPVSTTSDTTHLHVGRVLVGALGEDEFLVAGIDCRVEFESLLQSPDKTQLLRVEEGHFEGETWVSSRLWNGDETDYGLNFGGRGSLLKVKIGRYK